MAAGLRVVFADRAAESGKWRERGARSPEDDLARRSGTSRAAAKEQLATSKQIRKQPSVEQARRDGRLSTQQAAEWPEGSVPQGPGRGRPRSRGDQSAHPRQPVPALRP
jgi:hypothetical protein